MRTVLGGPAPGSAARHGGGAADGRGTRLQPPRGRKRPGRLWRGPQRHDWQVELLPARPASWGERIAGQPDAGFARLLAVPALPGSGLASPATQSRRAPSYTGDECCCRDPDPALCQSRLAERPLLGTALPDRPPAAAHVDAGTGGCCAARRRTGVLPVSGRRGHRDRSYRRLFVLPFARPADLRR